MLNLLGCLGDVELLVKYQDKLNMLLYRAEGNGLHLECINKEEQIYTIRLSGQPRLILHLHKVWNSKTGQEELYWVVLEEDLRHQYHSKYERNETAKASKEAYLEKNRDLIQKQIFNHQTLAETSDLPKINNAQSYIRYGEKIVLLSEEQMQLINHDLPIVVEGVAGSGKTCLGVAIIKKKLKEYSLFISQGASLEDLEPVFFTASSSPLVEYVRGLFQEGEFSYFLENGLLQVKTISDLLAPYVPGKTIVSYEESKSTFEKWYKETDCFSRMGGAFDRKDFSKESVFEEFRVISSGVEIYEKLGVDECLFFEQKKFLKDFYFIYCRYLDGENMVDFSMGNFDKEAVANQRCECMVVDEGADVPAVLVRLLLVLANRKNIFLHNEDQSLDDNLSKLPLFGKLGINVIQLQVMLRCPEMVAGLVRSFNQFKYHLNGGALSKGGLRRIEAHPDAQKGSVVLLDESRSEQLIELKEACRSSELVIITHDEHVLDAKELFGIMANVLTPKQAKGLEFPVVVCFRLFDKDVFRKINKLLQDVEFKDSYPNLPKAKALRFRCAKDIHDILVAMTRTLGSLYFIQNNSSHLLDNLLAPILEVMTQNQKRTDLTRLDYTEEGWKDLAKRYLKEGLDEEACNIFVNQLNGEKSKFSFFKEQSIPSVQTVTEALKVTPILNPATQIVAEALKVGPILKPSQDIVSTTKSKASAQSSKEIGQPPKKAKEIMLVMDKKSIRAPTAEEKFAEDLLKNFIFENVISLLSHKNPLKYLNAMVGDKDLYSRILELDDYSFSMFLDNVIKLPGAVDKISEKIKERLEIVLRSGIRSEGEVWFFFDVLHKDQRFFANRPSLKKFCEDFLRDLKNMELFEPEYFFMMCCFLQTKIGSDFFRKISKDKDFCRKITGSLFYRKFGTAAGPSAGLSIAFMCLRGEHFSLLENILKHNKEIILRDAPLTIFYKEPTDNSALCHLSELRFTPLLECFLDESARFYQDVPMSSWLMDCKVGHRILPAPVKNLLLSSRGASLFDKIITHYQNISASEWAIIFNEMALHDPDLFSVIPSRKDWILMLGVHGVESFLQFLSKKENGFSALEYLLLHNDTFVISFSDCFLTDTALTVFNSFLSNLFEKNHLLKIMDIFERKPSIFSVKFLSILIPVLLYTEKLSKIIDLFKMRADLYHLLPDSFWFQESFLGDWSALSRRCFIDMLHTTFGSSQIIEVLFEKRPDVFERWRAQRDDSGSGRSPLVFSMDLKGSSDGSDLPIEDPPSESKAPALEL